MRYWKKEILHNTVFDSYGKPINFDPVADNVGVLATDDAGLLAELDIFKRERRGGVVEIDKARFDELKKKLPSKRQNAPLGVRKLAIFNKTDDPFRKVNPEPVQPAAEPASAARAAASATVPAAVAPVESTNFVPRKGRPKKTKE